MEPKSSGHCCGRTRPQRWSSHIPVDARGVLDGAVQNSGDAQAISLASPQIKDTLQLNVSDFAREVVQLWLPCGREAGDEALAKPIPRKCRIPKG